MDTEGFFQFEIIINVHRRQILTTKSGPRAARVINYNRKYICKYTLYIIIIMETVNVHVDSIYKTTSYNYHDYKYKSGRIEIN